jgi:hypothetical protein
MIITIRHLKIAKMCSRGSRVFFERHGLDWSAFVRGGIDHTELEKTGDAMALRLIEVAREQR